MTQPTLDDIKRDIENFVPHDKGCDYRTWLDFIIRTGAGNGRAVARECNCPRREKIAYLERLQEPKPAMVYAALNEIGLNNFGPAAMKEAVKAAIKAAEEAK